ncbi:putative L-aspartate dehydrogenase isoform X1 [Rhinatrema bivittatum]|uniref:putative L-aspartate dehydrogenase isoform X1 n=1 Tax=Rhinatrema bivittatum TaxID=194408 RepID=UPI00112782E1|nr:putative L-aspartate dehydrogenase isoform X1 [Rhinatrema bivittatum]
MVDHQTLLHRLSEIGLTGKTINWFNSFLLNRSFQVNINNSLSELIPLETGVPQGSALSATLFNIYILPLCQLLSSLSITYYRYADDIQLLIPVTNTIENVLKLAATHLNTITNILNQMNLCLNMDKTECILLERKSQLNEPKNSIQIDNTMIKLSENVNNLGIWLDPELSFKKHIAMKTKEGFYKLSILKRLKPLLNQPEFRTILQSLIFTTFDYCNSLLIGLPKSATRLLQLLQNATVRILTNRKRSEHITPVLKELHWLPIKKRIDYKLLSIIHKNINNNESECLNTLLQKHIPQHNTRSANKALLTIPSVTTASLTTIR